MESVNKLRGWILSLYTPNSGELKMQGMDIADAIEREVAERFVELPVDADGVPWHIGDMVDGHGKVQSLDLNRHGWSFFGVENAIDPAIHRHAKPRTVVDVLEEFIAAYDEWDCNTYDDERMAGRRELFAKYADELRGLMEVD